MNYPHFFQMFLRSVPVLFPYHLRFNSGLSPVYLWSRLEVNRRWTGSESPVSPKQAGNTFLGVALYIRRCSFGASPMLVRCQVKYWLLPFCRIGGQDNRFRENKEGGGWGCPSPLLKTFIAGSVLPGFCSFDRCRYRCTRTRCPALGWQECRSLQPG